MEKGLELIKDVADLLKLQMSAFDDIKYVYGAHPFYFIWPLIIFNSSLKF